MQSVRVSTRSSSCSAKKDTHVNVNACMIARCSEHFFIITFFLLLCQFFHFPTSSLVHMLLAMLLSVSAAEKLHCIYTCREQSPPHPCRVTSTLYHYITNEKGFLSRNRNDPYFHLRLPLFLYFSTLIKDGI